MTDDRRLVVWVGVSIDGYTSGPGGPAHDAWLHEHAMRPQSLAYFEGIWRGADTQPDWTMAETIVIADGAVGLHYRRSH